MSFVGAHAIPLRHGLTLGELASLVNAELGLGLDLTVVACQGWDGGVFAASGLPWVIPSPNMPTPGHGPGLPGPGAPGGHHPERGPGHHAAL